MNPGQWTSLVSQPYSVRRDYIGPGYHYTRSMDAVLPWLSKHVVYVEHKCSQWRVVIHMGYTGDVTGPFAKRNDFVSEGEGELAYHVVIALLRAHGVEVEFTR